jgi:hypothetical protein
MRDLTTVEAKFISGGNVQTCPAPSAPSQQTNSCATTPNGGSQCTSTNGNTTITTVFDSNGNPRSTTTCVQGQQSSGGLSISAFFRSIFGGEGNTSTDQGTMCTITAYERGALVVPERT